MKRYRYYLFIFLIAGLFVVPQLWTQKMISEIWPDRQCGVWTAVFLLARDACLTCWQLVSLSGTFEFFSLFAGGVFAI